MPPIPASKKKSAILLIDCPDRKGLVAAVGEFLYRHDANILHADQHQDPERNTFLMRVEWDLAGFDIDLAEFPKAFAATAEKYQMRWRLERSDKPHRVALFVSKFDHCLADLLYRHRSGELACEIPLIISNHPDAQKWADFHGVPFELVPVDAKNKSAAEHRQLDLLRDHAVDLVVLARYMQVLSPGFCEAYRHRVINVHHSFLPAFIGAKPYHRAFEDLDEGPIIEQDVARISHRDTIDDLLEKGRDLERAVLAKAVRWHIDHRILVYGRKTVVFD
jgi:formyltetrahydrofolate deformylase